MHTDLTLTNTLNDIHSAADSMLTAVSLDPSMALIQTSTDQGFIGINWQPMINDQHVLSAELDRNLEGILLGSRKTGYKWKQSPEAEFRLGYQSRDVESRCVIGKV